MSRKGEPSVRWTPEELRHLREAAAEGATAAEIAAEMGRTPESVACKCKYHGIRLGKVGPRPDVIREAELLAYVASGVSVNVATKRMGLTPGSLNKSVRRLVDMGAMVRTGNVRNRYRVSASWRMGAKRSDRLTNPANARERIGAALTARGVTTPPTPEPHGR